MNWRGVARAVQRNLVWAALLVAPRRRYVVISGFPDTEGNAIEMLRATAQRYAGRIFLLVVDERVARRVLEIAGLADVERLSLVPRRSLAALYRFVTAEVVMFTHGLFGNPRRAPRKTLVNLWHGGGIKGGLMADQRGRPTIHSDFLVAATRRQGEILARQCRLPAGGLLITGNPRIDQFAQLDRDRLHALAISGDRPFVVWMPTFRRNAGHGLTAGWSETGRDSTDVNRVAERAVEALRARGVDVVVKPHPSDAESRRITGAVVVTNEALTEHGVLLYELIGAAAGLLTDFSSVWIDYLALDRPIGFVVPDAELFAERRGFDPPDALDWLPGERLETPADFARFADDVRADGALTAARRREVAAHLGVARRDSAAHAVLDDLAARGVFGGPVGGRAH